MSRQNGHFPDGIFKCIFLNENVWIPIKISLKFVPKGPINTLPALVRIMARRRLGDRPLSEPLMVNLPTYRCLARPQWVIINGTLWNKIQWKINWNSSIKKCVWKRSSAKWRPFCLGLSVFYCTFQGPVCSIVHFKAPNVQLCKGTFTLCPSPCPSPCPYQSPCPNNSHFLMKLEAVFRLHQFPYQSPIQCHQISVRSVSIGPPTVKNWYGRPFPSESCKSLYKITLWRLARQLWTWN